MSQPESNLSRKIMKEIRLHGWFCNKNHGSEFSMAGLPDITVCADGVYVALETKMPGKENDTSERQKYVIGKIRAAGGTAEVVSSPEDAIVIIQKALRDAGKAA